MLPSEITIEVRDRDLARQGQILPQYWSDVTLILNYLEVGEWSLSLPAELPIAQQLATPGAGLIVTGPDGVLLSGPMTNVTKKSTSDDPEGMLAFTGADDNVLLADAEAWPEPSNGDAASQTVAYDVRTGAAETIIRAFVDANIGPSAPATRRARLASHLTLAADGARGGTVVGSARFDTLGALTEKLAKVGGVGYRIAQAGSVLMLEMFTPSDKSKLIRLDVANGRLKSSDYGVSAPTVTRVLVAGQGDGAARTILERTNTDAQAAEDAWGRRIEQFKDQRNTDDPTELQQAGDEALVDGGKTVVSTKITPADDQTMRYGTDWGLGDIVTVVTGDVESPQIVSQAGISITKDGVVTGARVGTSKYNPDDLGSRVSALERKTPA